MKIFLASVPIIILILGFFIYRYNGRKELLKMDLIQFIYAFVLTPAVLIWIKTFVFFNLSSGLNINDTEDKFLIDTIITTLSFFIYAFVVIHSLTKTFAIKKEKDPLIDIFAHSEYFHLWLSHVVTFSSGLFIMFIVGLVNGIFPFIKPVNNGYLTLGVVAGIIMGLLFHKAVVIVENSGRFDRIMKLQMYIGTFLLIGCYILYRPSYSSQHVLYWCSALFFISGTVLTRQLKKTRTKQLPSIRKKKNHTNSFMYN